MIAQASSSSVCQDPLAAIWSIDIAVRSNAGAHKAKRMAFRYLTQRIHARILGLHGCQGSKGTEAPSPAYIVTFRHALGMT